MNRRPSTGAAAPPSIRAAVESIAQPAAATASDARHLSETFDETVERRTKFLTAYQNAAYAARYRKWADTVKAAEAAHGPGKCGLADAVARYLFKLMAYKDEYEVARLYTDGAFHKQVENEFDGNSLRFEFHLAPPLLARRDKTTGLPRKMSFGPWLLPAFRLLAKLKGLRGTPFDPFGRSIERRTERKLIADYEAMLDEVLAGLDAREPPPRGRPRGHSGEDPRLRPRQAEASRRRQGRRGGAPRTIPRRRAGVAQSGGVIRQPGRRRPEQSKLVRSLFPRTPRQARAMP